jgi:hypothetical protein
VLALHWSHDEFVVLDDVLETGRVEDEDGAKARE